MEKVATIAAPISRANPHWALLKRRQLLTTATSSKRTWHLELGLQGVPLDFQPGDSVGVLPRNSPALVARSLRALGLAEHDLLCERRSDRSIAAQELLTHKVSLQRVQPRLVTLLYELLPSGIVKEELQRLLAPEREQELHTWLQGRYLCELLEAFPGCGDPQQLINALPAMTPRFYSIANSSLAHPDELHLLVADSNFWAGDELRHGLCSQFLGEHATVGQADVPLFVMPSKAFHLPADGTQDIIMIGPGTGLAPFRAFLQQRMALAHSGRNWLFFGERNRASDFYYEAELQAYCQAGKLRLSTAFSRDQAHSIYVQHIMLELRCDLWQWLSGGATLYVCGDASKMAKDVQHACVEIAQVEGRLSREEALAWLRQLKQAGRYLEDVY